MSTARLLVIVLSCSPICVAACGGDGNRTPQSITGPSAATPTLPATLSNRILFTSNRAGFSMWSVQPDAAGLVQLPLSGSLLDVSPDGRRIAFTDAQQIHLANIDGTGRLTLTSQGRNVAPRWSPDGARILFWSNRDGNNEVYVMNADGSGQTNLSRHAAEDLEGTWSPDGARVAFRSQRSGDGDIYVMRSDGTGIVRLTSEPGQDANPRWSPDGARIVFDGHRGADFDIFVVNVDGTAAANLTRSPGIDAGPSWSADGRMIAFSSQRDGNSEVYVMNADGTGLRNLTNNPANDGDAVWVR